MISTHQLFTPSVSHKLPIKSVKIYKVCVRVLLILEKMLGPSVVTHFYSCIDGLFQFRYKILIQFQLELISFNIQSVLTLYLHYPSHAASPHATQSNLELREVI